MKEALEQILVWWIMIAPLGILIGVICSLRLDKEDVKLVHIIMYSTLAIIVIPLGVIALVWNKGEGIVVIKYKKKNDKQG